MLKIEKTPSGSTTIFCDLASGTLLVTKIVNRIIVFGDFKPLIITEVGEYDVVCESIDYVEGDVFVLSLE